MLATMSYNAKFFRLVNTDNNLVNLDNGLYLDLLGLISVTWIIFNRSMECNKITISMWVEITYPQTSTMQPLKFGNR